ncbi:hypothetical protein [Actinomyces glycerinitolerans]|uniref:Uncharacterized protein n=1 Tax=Actinomyces glycerinitolerans TaxID=1892869 RepID=A0A1M4RZ55_9ACTO|nr:hypothetical protein [Actinomyces glycerinitolerans]SHE25209.1 Hypothetical protein ACGLYG10_1425 [Actinomyces glycerinitolerans]
MSTTYGRNTSPTDDLALLLGDATPRVVRTAAAQGIRLAEDGTEVIEQPADPGLPPQPDDDDEEEDDAADPVAVAATRGGARIARTAATMTATTALL